MKEFCFKIVICSLIMTLTMSGWSQNESQEVNKWKFAVSPYIMFPYMNGELVVKGFPEEVSVSPSDIFDNLNWGMMLSFEASNDNWVILMDGLYMDLGVEGETPLLSRKVELSVNQLGISFYGMYKIKPWLDAGLGGRVNSIESVLKIAPGEYILPGSRFAATRTWFDPLLVARVNTSFGDSNWRGVVLMDLGGFGLGSDLTWQFNPYVGYRFSKLFQLNLSYRWLYINYEDGSDVDRFVYDITTSGPEVRLSFHF